MFGLSSCGGGDSVNELTADTPKDKPFVRIVFDPATSNLSLPNDLLMIPNTDLFDFTLATEGDATFDGTNPQHALSALDGWSTTQPFQIKLTVPSGVDVDPVSVGAASIRLFEASQALEGTSSTCQQIAAEVQAPGIPCELGDELQYGIDYVASYTLGAGSISVVPLKPLRSAQGHMLVVTTELKDTDGKSVLGSTSWELTRQDINTMPLATADQLQLQGLVNYLVNVLQPAGLEREQVSYAAYFSTSSSSSILTTVKQLQIGGFAQALQTMLANGASLQEASQFAAQYLPSITTQAATNGATAFEYLAPSILSAEVLAQLTAVNLNTCAGLMSTLENPSSPLFATAQQTFASVGPYCAASRVAGTVKLPYYLSPAEPLTDWWRAACTNGAMLKALGADTVTALVNAGSIGPNNALCQAASNNQLFDLNLTSIGIDDPRNVTKFSPIPVARGRNIDDPNTLYNEAGTETINVHITIPDENVIAALAAASGGTVNAITKPQEGWPVVIFQHGITGSKENVLAMSATLSLAGFATVAIDHPLHGQRGFTLENGREVDSGDFMNITSLLTGRDNSRQSIVDTMGLRLALNAIVDQTGKVDINQNDVHFIGQSLGAITGTGTVAISNTSLPDNMASLNSMYHFNSAVLNVPAGGIGSFLLASPSFGNIIKGSILASSSTDFQLFLSQYAANAEITVEEAIAPAFAAFLTNLTASQLAEINNTFTSFEFVSQTVLNSADPVNYGGILAANTPSLVQLVVGGGSNDDGSVGLSDQVNPVSVTNRPLAGGMPLASAIMGLSTVSSTSQGSGVVLFNAGVHQSLLSPSVSLATTTEMQKQAAAFFATGGQIVVISDLSVVQN